MTPTPDSADNWLDIVAPGLHLAIFAAFAAPRFGDGAGQFQVGDQGHVRVDGVGAGTSEMKRALAEPVMADTNPEVGVLTW